MEVVQAFLSGVPLIRVAGDIDHDTSAALEAAVKKSLTLDHGRLLLDLEACPYIDSGGLAVILDAVSAVQGRGWVGVLHPNADVSRLLEMVGLPAREGFVIFPDEAAAAKRIGASAGKRSSLPSA
jgi:anti-anti-sigma factor